MTGDERLSWEDVLDILADDGVADAIIADIKGALLTGARGRQVYDALSSEAREAVDDLLMAHDGCSIVEGG